MPASLRLVFVLHEIIASTFGPLANYCKSPSIFGTYMRHLLSLLLLFSPILSGAHTQADSLRGSNGSGRRTWDVRSYQLRVKIDTVSRTISGTNRIQFNCIAPTDSMQIDLQGNMQIDAAELDSIPARFRKDGNVTWIYHPVKLEKGSHFLRLQFSGKPRVAVNPPWDGGFIWTKDSSGHPWISVACQGLGASSWWPCKDDQSDEPEDGIWTEFEGMQGMKIVSNGRYLPDEYEQATTPGPQTGKNSRWRVRNPINLYDVCFYAGDYVHWSDTMHGEEGLLTIDFYPLRVNEAKSRSHWAMTKDMLHCFEYWMGPYPFYADGYKLVEAPFLGMEHQSAVAYGNRYKMGYAGLDRSSTNVGLSFDFIIVHESGHEWFGNSITANDPAENWIHEGLTSYIEGLYAEWIRGRANGFYYTRGKWAHILNDRPVVGQFGVNDDGSSDRYDKAAAAIHMIRLMLHDDARFRKLLRGISREFYHKTIDGRDLENYISRETGLDLRAFFSQYLRTTVPPTLIVKESGGGWSVQLKDAVKGLHIPVYDEDGQFVCNLSRKVTRISDEKLPALRNYYFRYDAGTPTGPKFYDADIRTPRL